MNFWKRVKSSAKSWYWRKSIDFVASHGQTIWHSPMLTQRKQHLANWRTFNIAYGLQTKVVADFRVMDMAAGGQGAPLVPYTDYLLYQSDSKNRLLQNIGGIGNVTVLQKWQLKRALCLWYRSRKHGHRWINGSVIRPALWCVWWNSPCGSNIPPCKRN